MVYFVAMSRKGKGHECEEREWRPDLIERSRYWSDIRRSHFGYSHNILLGLSTALLAFIANMLRDDHYNPDIQAKKFIRFATLFLGIAFTFGIFCIFTRLWDFRLTADAIRRRSFGVSITGSQFRVSRLFGTLTWYSLYIQAIFLFLGVLYIARGFSRIYHSKIW
jgi:hypothetical protein